MIERTKTTLGLLSVVFLAAGKSSWKKQLEKAVES